MQLVSSIGCVSCHIAMGTNWVTVSAEWSILLNAKRRPVVCLRIAKRSIELPKQFYQFQKWERQPDVVFLAPEYKRTPY